MNTKIHELLQTNDVFAYKITHISIVTQFKSVKKR